MVMGSANGTWNKPELDHHQVLVKSHDLTGNTISKIFPWSFFFVQKRGAACYHGAKLPRKR
jgi:hypothetical protein